MTFPSYGAYAHDTKKIRSTLVKLVGDVCRASDRAQCQGPGPSSGQVNSEFSRGVALLGNLEPRAPLSNGSPESLISIEPSKPGRNADQTGDASLRLPVRFSCPI